MKKILFICALSFLVIPNFVYAMWPLSGAPCDGLQPYTGKVCDLLLSVQGILYIISFSVAVLFIIIAGIQYMTAGEKEDQLKTAKKTIINALIGAAIILASGFLVGIVAEILGNTINKP